MFEVLIKRNMRGQSTKDLINTYWLVFLVIGLVLAVIFVFVGSNGLGTKHFNSECYISLQINCRSTNIIRSNSSEFIFTINITNRLGERIVINNSGIQMRFRNGERFYGSCGPKSIKNNQNSSCRILVPINSIDTNGEIRDSIKINYSICNSFGCMGDYTAIGSAYQYYN